jgi:hypothetical protein
MNLVIKNPNAFKVVDGKIKSKTKFEVTKQGNNLIIQGDENSQISTAFNGITINQGNNGRASGGNYYEQRNSTNSIGRLNGSSLIGICGDFKNIHISQKNISFNGYTFNFKNGELYINGIKFIEDKTKSEPSKKEELKENEYLEYPLEKDSINAISISSSAILIIDDLSILSDNDVNIALQGSGSVVTKNNSEYFIKSLNCSVQGSGDIEINKFQCNSCNCSVQGSGDIVLRDSKYENLNLNIMGSGDITGENTTADKISKNIMGSGDINGF